MATEPETLSPACQGGFKNSSARQKLSPLIYYAVFSISDTAEASIFCIKFHKIIQRYDSKNSIFVTPDS